MKKLFTIVVLIALFISFGLHTTAYAQDSNPDVEEYMENIGDECTPSYNVNINLGSPIVLSGDIQGRYLYDHMTDTDLQTLRFRIGAIIPITDNMTVKTRLNSEEFDTGQTRSRIMGFDIAEGTYFDSSNNINYTVSFGKMESPFFNNNELVFDEDTTFEGLASIFDYSVNTSSILTLTTGYYNNVITGAQLSLSLFDGQLMVGTGMYNYQNLPTNREIFGSLNSNVQGIPITVSGGYTKTAYDAESWVAALKLGQLNEAGSIEGNFKYHFADEVVSPYGSRDWVDPKGFDLETGIQLTENVSTTVSYLGKDFQGSEYQYIGAIKVEF